MESPLTPHTSGKLDGASGTSFLKDVCLSYLLDTQNADGGWGFQAASQSRTEPTVWALLALLESAPNGESPEVCSRGFRFLSGAQLQDGSWSSSPQQQDGSWVTSLACWALLAGNELPGQFARGLNWLCDEIPAEARPWRRLLRRFTAKQHIAAQNDSYYGWSWTPGTASWVEPTSYATILLHMTPKKLLPAGAERRHRLAEAMLYDRMCPGGGWNCGNPMVYGVPGEPQVAPTAWALLALKEYPEKVENRKSLDWLDHHLGAMQSPASLALGHIAMDVYGRLDPETTKSLCALYQKTEIMWNVPGLAWAALAVSETRNWLSPSPERNT